MTYKIDPIISRICSPVVLEIGATRKRYCSGVEAAEDMYRDRYQIETIRAEFDMVVIRLALCEGPAAFGPEPISFFD